MTLGRVAFVVLGCAKNQVEAESMSSRLAREGWDLTADIPNANLVVVHSCGFLDAARREARETLVGIRRSAPRAAIVLTGCFAQYLNGRRIPGVDAVLGTGQFDRLPEVLARLRGGSPPTSGDGRGAPSGYHDPSLPRPLRAGQLSAYLRLSEGCNHRCAFCIIPQLRGPLRSRSPGDIYAEARGLTERGVRELVLISQDTTDYGRDLGGIGLTDIIRELASWPSVSWLRILYAHPTEVDRRFIDLLAEEPKLAGYLDMPLQHIADPLLRAMGREKGERETRRLLDQLVRRVPSLALRTTFIVGFPGETDADFKRLEGVVRDGVFEHVGVFPYSFEPRSPSARLPGLVPTETVNERWQALLDAQRAVKDGKDRARVGRTVTTLVERSPDGAWTARASHQAPEVDGEVRLSRPPRAPGFHSVLVTGVHGIDLRGRLSAGRLSKTKSKAVVA